MSSIAATYLGFLIFALITLIGSVAVTTITSYTVASAQASDERAIALFDSYNALLMLVAMTLVFVLMLLTFLAIIFPDVLKFQLHNRVIGFSLMAGFFSCITLVEYSLLPFRFWFLKRFGILPISTRKALLRRTTQVTIDEVLHDLTMLSVVERKHVLAQLATEVA